MAIKYTGPTGHVRGTALGPALPCTGIISDNACGRGNVVTEGGRGLREHDDIYKDGHAADPCVRARGQSSMSKVG